MDIDPNAVSVVACAAGHLCQAPQGADLSKSTHICLNCDNCLHSHVFCGKPWSMLENIVPRKHLSVNGAAKASSTSNPEAITVCYTCLSNIALLCDQEADDTICAMLPGATLSEDVPSVLPPPPALPPLANTSDTTHSPTGAVSFDSSLLFAEDGNEPAAGTTEDGKKKQKRDEKKDDNEKKKRMKIEQVERFTIKDVVANAPGTELISIGGLPISKITLDMLKAFCAKNKISIPMAERKKTAIPAVILSYIKAGPMKERITAGTRKKKGAATTKPACLVTDGTIYRTIITITCEKGKPLFIATRGSHDKNMLDTRKPHPFEWDGLNAIYGSDEPELDCIGDMQELLLGYDIDVDISSIYDKLNTTEFRLVCNYVLAFYRKAMNAKSLSGNHKPIDAYIEGKPWIAFLHARLQAIGDSALMDCAYAQLPDSVFRSSDQPTSSARGRNSRGPSATERTASRVSSYSHPNQATISARKYDLLEANERTTKSIHDKHAQEIEYATQDRFVSMKKSLFEASRDLASVRRKVRSMNWSTEDYESLKMEKKSLKGNVKYLQKQYDQLKKDVGYDSPSDSSDSESDEDPTSSSVLA